MSLFFIDSRLVQNGQICLSGELAHRLRSVLRCKPGETIVFADENQTRYTATIGKVTPDAVLADIQTSQSLPKSTTTPIQLFQAVLKGKKMDWVIQKGTELGMSMLVPVVTERTIPRPHSDRGPHQLERWRKIALEAAQQCGRREAPEIAPTVLLSELCKTPPGSQDGKHSLRLLLWEQEKSLSLKSALSPSGKAGLSIFTGPEGGISETEFVQLKQGGWNPVSLGPRILRAETAGMAVLAAILYERSEVMG